MTSIPDTAAAIVATWSFLAEPGCAPAGTVVRGPAWHGDYHEVVTKALAKAQLYTTWPHNRESFTARAELTEAATALQAAWSATTP